MRFRQWSLFRRIILRLAMAATVVFRSLFYQSPFSRAHFHSSAEFNIAFADFTPMSRQIRFPSRPDLFLQISFFLQPLFSRIIDVGVIYAVFDFCLSRGFHAVSFTIVVVKPKFYGFIYSSPPFSSWIKTISFGGFRGIQYCLRGFHHIPQVVLSLAIFFSARFIASLAHLPVANFIHR